MKTETKLEQLKNEFSIYQIITGFQIYYENQKLNDKHSIGYFIGMIEGANCYYSLYSELTKRKVLTDRLTKLLVTETLTVSDVIHEVNIKNLFTCVHSDYVVEQVRKQIIKNKI